MDEQKAAFTRVPPHSQEAEESVLGALLTDSDAFDRIADLVIATDFYVERHGRIFAAITMLHSQARPADVITVTEALKQTGELQRVGGTAFLVELAERVVTAANIDHYARLVHDKATLRRLIRASSEILSGAYESRGATRDFLDKAEQAIFELSSDNQRSALRRIDTLISSTVERIEMLFERKSDVTGVATGYYDLDHKTAGLQPSDLIIVAGRPSMGKCLTADSEIVLEDGRVRTIEQIVRARCGTLLTLNDQWRFEPATPSAFVDDGIKPVFEVTTRLGRRVRTTLSHPFLTIDGWKPLGEIRPGDHVAVPRRLPVAGRESIGEDRAKILGYLIGDGSVRGSSVRFTNTNPRIQDDFADAVRRFGGLSLREEGSPTRARTVRVSGDLDALRSRRRDLGLSIRQALAARQRSAASLAAEIGVSPGSVSHWCSGATAPTAQLFSQLCGALALDEAELAPEGHASLRHSEGSGLMRWLDGLGLRGKGAREKFIPDVVFGLVPDELACFLNRLFATDGWASVLATGQAQIGICTASERMARQIQHLLLRFGVVARLRARQVRYQGGTRSAYQLDITDRTSMLHFIDKIGIFGKEDAIARVRLACDSRREKAFRDIVPAGVWRRIDAARAGESWSGIGSRMGLLDSSNLHVGRGMSRRRLAAFAEALDDQGLRDLAGGDVYWDIVDSVESVGMAQVYDLTVDKSHNFVANDVCVHNTAFCLNIAEYAAGECNVGVAVFSMEMSSDQLVMRMLCSQAEIDNARVRTGNLHDRDIKNIALTAGKLGGAPIYIDDSPGQTVLEIRAKARRLKHDHAANLGLIVIDYLQLMRGTGEDSREQEISAISRSLKGLAKELNVPIVALSQLNRQVEMRADKRPGMADLRESGALEQDADVIIFLYRDEQYNADTAEPGVAEVIIAKQRNGPTGTVRLMFDKAFARFRNFSNREDANSSAAYAGQYE
ncbi:MAG: replicative DNA helicase [Candidatus Binatia bacterium]